jgi:TRAP transporter TAXI family solute receptor
MIERTRRRPRLTPWLLSAALALASGCGGASTGDTRFLSIATGGTGGVYYPYGGGIAKILNQHLPKVRATAEVTAASVDNLKLIRDGRADLAFTFADTLDDAVHGRGAFQQSGPVRAASLAVLYPNFLHVVTSASSGIRQFSDLRGRVVSTGSPGSGTEVLALRMLKAAGLEPDRDVRRQGLGVTESADALKDGKIDAFFWGGGVPTPALQDLSHTPGMSIRMIPSGDLVPALQKAFGAVYFEAGVPPGVYPGIEGTVSMVASYNVLVVNAAMDEPLVYDIVRTIFEHRAELGQIHPEARKLSLETAVGASPAAFHPGAIRYYREKGAWTQ